MSKFRRVYVALFACTIIGCADKPIATQPKEFPALVAQLRGARSLCESRGAAVRSKFRDPSAEDCSSSYGDAKAKLDVCISLLQSGLGGGFQGVDGQQIQDSVSNATSRMSSFVDRADAKLNRPLRPRKRGESGEAIDLIPGLAQLVADYAKFARAQRNQDNTQLSNALDACRLTDWDEL